MIDLSSTGCGASDIHPSNTCFSMRNVLCAMLNVPNKRGRKGRQETPDIRNNPKIDCVITKGYRKGLCSPPSVQSPALWLSCHHLGSPICRMCLCHVQQSPSCCCCAANPRNLHPKNHPPRLYESHNVCQSPIASNRWSAQQIASSFATPV